jgi:Phage protein (N4 Gp49/phage Sf6 gene 66) family
MKEPTDTSNFPRITQKDLEDQIREVQFLNSGVLTICILTMQNGYRLTGESACAHPSLYNKELGEKLALDSAVKKMWPLLGYMLREKLHREEISFVDRMKLEHEDLSERLVKLKAFIMGPKFNDLSKTEGDDLELQLGYMESYADILGQRLQRNS